MVYRNIFHIIWYNITIWYGNIAILYGTQLIITYNTVGLRRISFFSEICSPRSVTNLFAQTHPPPFDQNLLLSRDAIVNLPVVGGERTRDEGGWGLAADELKYK